MSILIRRRRRDKLFYGRAFEARLNAIVKRAIERFEQRAHEIVLRRATPDHAPEKE